MKMSFNYGHPPLPLNPPPPPPPMQMPILSQQGHNQMMTGQMMMGAMIGPQGFHQGMMGSLINPDHMGNSPGMNDAPLEFNTNKNKPPMPISSEELESEQRKAERNQERLKAEKEREIEEERKLKEIQRKRDRDRNRDRGRDRRDREKERDRRDERDHKGSSSSSNGKSSPGSRSPQPPEASVGTAGQGGQGPAMWGGIMAPPMPPMGPYPVMGMNPMMMDPSVMIGQYNMMGMGMGADGTMLAGDQGPPSLPMAKEVIQFKEFSLFPPSPNAPPPTTRERPPGCKTIFVGGLPENATEEMIRELFGRCGEMLTVRLNNKKFCHIRFLHEASVDAALYFSGYRMRIGSNTDAPNTGRLHVDYAQARDDQYEWECRQRQAQREQRHRDRVEKERLRVPSPPPVQHYTDHEANLVAEKIKSDDDFTKAVQVVITWLERGDCSKRNANTFYSMIQSTNSHVRRLLTEKATYEEELTRAKELMKGRMQGLLIQFSQIERVFSAASHKKVWDHFTKPQRKNIEMWKKQASEIKSVELEDNLLAGGDEEMEVSDTDDEFNAGSVRKKQRKEDTTFLKEENDSLRCQLEAYKNEVDLVKSDLKMELEQKEKQLKVCQQTLQGMQQQLLDAKRKQGEDELKALDLQAKLKAKQEREKKEGDGNDREEEINEVDTTESLLMLSSKLSEKEAKLIGLISIFLHVHPFGAGVDYIWSYLQKLDPSLRTSDVEALMSRFPAMFQQELSGIGANMERRWVYAGFHTD